MKRPTKRRPKDNDGSANLIPGKIGGVIRVASPEKLEIFVSEYIKHHNGTRAAIAAGYSPNSAYTTGSALLKNPKVKKLLDEDRARYRRKTDITIESLLNELKLIGFARSGDYVFRDHKGNLHLRADGTSDTEKSAAIEEINLKTGKIKLHDKLEAIDKLGLHLGMWGRDRKISEADLREITIKGGLPDVPYEKK